MAPPENFLSYHQSELPSIFPKLVKPQDPNYTTIVDKEIKISFKKKMVKSVSLAIELDKCCSIYEIEVHCETESKAPEKLIVNNRPTVLIGGLEEDKLYKARVRGIYDEDKHTMTKWSQEISFYPLKGIVFNFYINLIFNY